MECNGIHGRKAAYYTLGCKLNFSETSTIERTLQSAGVRNAGRGEQADICVVNTCSVTEMADKKCRQAIHRIVRQNPNACVVVTGCYGQLSPEQVQAIPGVDMVLGQDQKGRVLEHILDYYAGKKCTSQVTPASGIREFVPSCSKGDRTRYFLKVQDGCDYFCTYCTVPYARGRSRNPRIEDLVAAAREAAAEGAREIVLTGVNIGDFGKSTSESFLDLVKALDNVKEVSRYRISSIEPNLLTDDVIDFVAESRAFMPHFHIPLQSGSDQVLSLMHRRYTRSVFEHKVERIRSVMPDAFIGVDVIVGARGETPECFNDSMEFISGLDVSHLHVFSYSERPGTAALKIPYVVSDAEKHRRSAELIDLSDRKTDAFYRKFAGTEALLLVEKPKRGQKAQGYTENYIRAELPTESAELENRIVKVRLGGYNAKADALVCTLI